MEKVEALLFIFFALVALVIMIWASVEAVRSLTRGVSPWKTFEQWLIRVVEAVTGIG